MLKVAIRTPGSLKGHQRCVSRHVSVSGRKSALLHRALHPGHLSKGLQRQGSQQFYRPVSARVKSQISSTAIIERIDGVSQAKLHSLQF